MKNGLPFSHTKNRSSHKENHALCLVELGRNPVLWNYDILPINETINLEKYWFQLVELKSSIEQKRPKIARINAQSHVSDNSTKVVGGWDGLPHSPYLSDLASSNFPLFSTITKFL